MEKNNETINSASTLTGQFYNSAELLERSKSELFIHTWQLNAEHENLRLPDSAFPFSFMDGFIDEPLVFTRNKSDEIKCLSNVCTHRANILIESPCQLHGGIRCNYHGRRFKSDGTFESMPECEHMENFPSERDNLAQVDFKKWKQFYFTSLTSKISFEELIAPMAERVGWMPIEQFVYDPKRSQEYLVRANWVLYCDNYLEGFHIPYIHKDLSQSLDYSSYKSEIYKYSNLQLGIAKSGESCFDLPENSVDFGKQVAAYYFWLFPNIMFNFYPWGLSVNIIRPLQYNLTKVIFKSYVWDERKINLGAGALLDRVEREDEAIVERVQKGSNALLYKSGRYSPKMEQGVHHFHQLIRSFMSL